MNEILIYTTFPDKTEAYRICRILLEKRLIACANIFSDHDSLYWWQDAIQESAETAAVLKSTPPLFADIQAVVVAEHPYECPALVALPITAGHALFLEWIARETKNKVS